LLASCSLSFSHLLLGSLISAEQRQVNHHKPLLLAFVATHSYTLFAPAELLGCRGPS
jgi:hypothetical protein